MKLTLDSTYNIAYLQLREKSGTVETIRLSDDVLIDVAPDGTVYGIEFLNANEQLGGSLEVEGVSIPTSHIPLKA